MTSVPAQTPTLTGATGTSYTVTSYEAGRGIKVRVSFTDDAGHEELLTSYAVAVAMPAPPLTADFPQSPYQSLSHKGADDRPQVIVEFSRAVAAFAKTTPSVSVTGGTVYSVLAHEENGLKHAWVFFLDPTGTDDIQFSLLTGQSCEEGGVCAEDGTTLLVAPGTRIIPGPEEEEDETAVNSAATGAAPIVRGTVQVGETLTADTSGISPDADGLIERHLHLPVAGPTTPT